MSYEKIYSFETYYFLQERESLELWLSRDDDLYRGPAERTDRGLTGIELL